MSTSTEQATALPTLRSWLAGVAQHPLHQLMRRPPGLEPDFVVYAWWRDPILTIFDELIAALERAQPKGLSRTRRRFKELGDGPESRNDLYRLRAELVVAASLIENGVSFRINPNEGPDFLVDEAAGQVVGIEVSTRAPLSLATLGAEVAAQLEALGVPAAVQFIAEGPPPVSIRGGARQRILDHVVQAALAGGQQVLFEEAVPARIDECKPASMLQIQISHPAGLTQPSVSAMAAIHPGSPHLEDIAEEIAKQPLRDEQKRRQAMLMPTVLVTDVTHCGGSTNRQLTEWLPIFDRIWAPGDPFVGLVGMICHYNHRTPTFAASVNPHRADQLHLIQQALGDAAMSALGLA